MRKRVTLKGIRFDKYEVDEDGNIYRKGSETPLKPFGDGRGYLRVDLMDNDNKKHMAKIHLVVAHTFLGKQKEGFIINHKDANKHNNKLNNLEYISQRENVAHAQINVKNLRYLDDDTIKQIIKSKKNGDKIVDISDELDLPTYVVRDVLNGKTYNHIKR